MTPEVNRIYAGDCLSVMAGWPDAFIQTCVTSPPYWGLRDYGMPGQLGLDVTLENYIAKMVDVFCQVRRVLRDDGTLWLNMGDSYTSGGRSTHGTRIGYKQESNGGSMQMQHIRPALPSGLKTKDLVGVPWRLAFALQADGWYLRSDIIWAKPNPMPESVTDRPTKAHEYLFLLAKSEKYFYDAKAISEPGVWNPAGFRNGHGAYVNQSGPQNNGSKTEGQGKPFFKDARRNYDGKYSDKQRGHGRRHAGFNDRWDEMEKTEQCSGMRNKRSVWTVSTMPYSEAHFATFPPDLIKPCILAGCSGGGIVFDPFMGAGTTALVAATYNRDFIGIELNPEYVAIANARIARERSQVKMAI